MPARHTATWCAAASAALCSAPRMLPKSVCAKGRRASGQKTLPACCWAFFSAPTNHYTFTAICDTTSGGLLPAATIAEEQLLLPSLVLYQTYHLCTLMPLPFIDTLISHYCIRQTTVPLKEHPPPTPARHAHRAIHRLLTCASGVSHSAAPEPAHSHLLDSILSQEQACGRLTTSSTTMSPFCLASFTCWGKTHTLPHTPATPACSISLTLCLFSPPLQLCSLPIILSGYAALHHTHSTCHTCAAPVPHATHATRATHPHCPYDLRAVGLAGRHWYGLEEQADGCACASGRDHRTARARTPPDIYSDARQADAARRASRRRACKMPTTAAP